MRKFLFFLLLLPPLVSLGHDAYIYYQKPEKGFQLSDLGALWDKHHKESHDQWKTKVKKFSKSVEEYIPENPVPKNMIPEGLIPEKEKDDSEDVSVPSLTKDEISVSVEEEGIEKVTNNFSEGFTQSIERDGMTNVKKLEPGDCKDDIEENTDKLIATIGFLLEQKAVFVLGAIPLFFFILNFVLSRLFKKKDEMDKVRTYKKKKRKGGGYAYSRK